MTFRFRSPFFSASRRGRTKRSVATKRRKVEVPVLQPAGDNDNVLGREVSDFLHSPPPSPTIPCTFIRTVRSIRGIRWWAYQLVFPLASLLPRSFPRILSLKRSPFLPPVLSRAPHLPPPVRSSLVLQTGRPKEASDVALSSLSIRADSVELPSSKVRASNEAINKSTALTGLSTLFVRDDVSILGFFSCLRVYTRWGRSPRF